jgi:hypothetical protein
MSSYNGWSNYETWAVALWIDNEAPSYRFWRDVADAIKGDVKKKRERIYALAERLKLSLEDEKPDLGASMWADLLGAAFSEVNWQEIAKNILDET